MDGTQNQHNPTTAVGGNNPAPAMPDDLRNAPGMSDDEKQYIHHFLAQNGKRTAGATNDFLDAFMTQNMATAIQSTPELAVKAKYYDMMARKKYGEHLYDLYRQGDATIILKRVNTMPGNNARVLSSQSLETPSGVKRVKVKCSECRKDHFDFARHNQESHYRHPGILYFCPVCLQEVARSDPSCIDDHLANHSIYLRLDDRGGQMMKATQGDKIKRLSMSGLRENIKRQGAALQGYMEQKESILEDVDYLKEPCGQMECFRELRKIDHVAVFTDNDTQGLAKKALITRLATIREALFPNGFDWDKALSDAEWTLSALDHLESCGKLQNLGTLEDIKEALEGTFASDDEGTVDSDDPMECDESEEPEESHSEYVEESDESDE